MIAINSGGAQMKRQIAFTLILILLFGISRWVIAEEKEKMSKSIKALAQEIKEVKNPEERRKLISQMAKGVPKAEEEINILLDIMKSKEEELSISAEKALNNTKDKTFSPLFIEALDDRSPRVQRLAIRVLAIMKEKKAVPKLIRHFKKQPKNRDEYEVKITAAFALGEIGDERAIEPLLQEPLNLEWGFHPVAKIGAPVVSHLIRAAKDKTHPYHKHATSALADIEDREAILQLIGALRDENPEVRSAAVGALRKMKAKEAEPFLKELLEDTKVGNEALYALVSIGGRKYLPEVMQFLERDSLTAIKVLGELKESTAIPKLEQLLRHKKGSVRHQAATALWKITGKVYKYEKDKFTQSSEERWKRLIRDNPALKKIAQDQGYCLEE